MQCSCLALPVVETLLALTFGVASGVFAFGGAFGFFCAGLLVAGVFFAGVDASDGIVVGVTTGAVVSAVAVIEVADAADVADSVVANGNAETAGEVVAVLIVALIGGNADDSLSLVLDTPSVSIGAEALVSTVALALVVTCAFEVVLLTVAEELLSLLDLTSLPDFGISISFVGSLPGLSPVFVAISPLGFTAAPSLAAADNAGAEDEGFLPCLDP